MKRPFAWFCIVCAAVPAVGSLAGGSGQEFSLRAASKALLQAADARGEVTLAGTVAECSAVSSGVRLSVDHLTIQKNDLSEQSFLSDFKIEFTTEHTELLPGDALVVSGVLSVPEPPSNPGQFDAQSYYDAQNVAGLLRSVKIREQRPGRRGPAAVLQQIRNALRASYDRILGEKPARLIAAISLGEKQRLEQGWKDTYQEGGISHILAISGLHISLIGMCLYRLLRRIGAPFGAAAAASGMTVLAYAWMTGFGVSAMRAALMFLFWLGAQVWGRKYDMATALAAAAAAVLWSGPGNLTQASFLLSFGAVLTLLVLPARIRASFARRREGESGRVSAAGSGNVLCAGLSVWLGTLPISLYFFYQTAPWSLLVNLAVVPLMSVVMICGLLSAEIGLFSVRAGTFFAAPVHYLLALFEGLCDWQKCLPYPALVAGRPSALRIAAYYALLLAAAAFAKRLLCSPHGRRTVRGARLVWLACALGAAGLLLGEPADRLEILCLDVGQGDSSLLRFPSGETCLIDGGSSSQEDVWRYRIGQAAKHYGVRTLDYVFLSHADADHISGVEEFLREYEPNRFGQNVHGITLLHLVLPPPSQEDDFRELRRLAQERGIEVLRMEAGASVGSAGGDPKEAWTLSCLAPDGAAMTGDRNEDSMVLMLRYGAFRMLFTGDLEAGAERRLAASDADLDADVLKVGHHGSGKASSEEFLARVTPTVSVISCGKNNRYGHPAAETVSRLARAGSRILETPECGAVAVSSDGRTYSVRTFFAQDGGITSRHTRRRLHFATADAANPCGFGGKYIKF